MPPMALHHDIRATVVAASVALGGVRKVGKAPPSFIGRELQEFLETMEM